MTWTIYRIYGLDKLTAGIIYPIYGLDKLSTGRLELLYEVCNCILGEEQSKTMIYNA